MPSWRRSTHERGHHSRSQRHHPERTPAVGKGRQGAARHVRAGKRCPGGGAACRLVPGRAGLPRAQRGRRGAPLHPALAVELRCRQRHVPAWLVHHEVQPQDQREGCGDPGPGGGSPDAPRRAGAGQPAGDVRAAELPGGHHRPAGSDPAAGRRGPWRAHRHAHFRCLAQEPQLAAHQDPHPRHRPRHQPGQRRPVRLQAGADPLRAGGHPRGGSSRGRHG